MKQMLWLETFFRHLYPAWLVFFPVLLIAQTFDTTPPSIYHQAVKLSRINRPLPLIAYLSDQSGVRETMVKVNYRGESSELAMATDS
ncbi:hypothetical protein JXO59_13730, partial [candidate division KSB1 bacterium]|nr:hypothetical protein [candidate division KSB1 bacterium]